MQDAEKGFSLSFRQTQKLRHTSISQPHHQRALQDNLNFPKVFLALPCWKYHSLSKAARTACACGSHPLQHSIRQLGSSGGFARDLLLLHQNESEPTPVLHPLLEMWGQRHP